jgi:hypothetical protein
MKKIGSMPRKRSRMWFTMPVVGERKLTTIPATTTVETKCGM